MRILISYEYFRPAFKAGGPIQSINNLALYLSTIGVEVYIFCSDKDLDGEVLDVEPDKWVRYDDNIKVYYNSSTITGLYGVSKLISGVQPDFIFINGLYSLLFTIYPLMYTGDCKKILSVRGMLHPGALSQKSFKKNVFLKIFRTVGLDNKCEYHSTSDIETEYIYDIFGKDKKVWMIPNLPNLLAYQEPLNKSDGSIRLVSVSLISPMKNILRVLEELEFVEDDISVTYDIYGPVKDAEYWDRCQVIIKNSNRENISINYKGELVPDDIPDTLMQYHCLILPSKSENFGHAIYEAMAAGKPVITSHNTPWAGLEAANAGKNIDPDNKGEIKTAIEEQARLNEESYVNMCESVRKYITGKYNIDHIKSAYNNMFSLQEEKIQ